MNVSILPCSEIRRVHPLIPKFLAEFGHPEPFNPGAFDGFWAVLYGADMGRIFVAEQDGQVVGALGYSVHDDPYTGSKIASEQFWFVLPEYRASKIGLELIAAFEAHAKKIGREWIFLCNLISLEAEKLDRLYVRNGYRAMERVYWKKISTEEKS